MNRYDVVIIGSGLGGLSCGVTLSKEGLKVCVIEKNPLPGGCFQSFRRNGVSLDTGIHYIGSMGEGQILNRYFNYFGILDKIKLRRMDEEAFDRLHIRGKRYPFAMGHDNFTEKLTACFPRERENIRKYVSLLKETGNTIHPDHLKKGKLSTGSMEHFSSSAWDTICRVTSDPDLREVLSGAALLYGGDRNSSNWYHHSMIANSYVEGAYRLVDGSMQVVDALVREIEKQGGTVLTKAEATRLVLVNGQIGEVEVNGCERLQTKQVISTIHPYLTMSLIDKTPLIRQAYLSRLSSLPHSYGLLSVYLIQKKGKCPYLNRNEFIYGKETVWHDTLYPDQKTINCAMLSMQPNSATPEYTDVICLVSPMHYDEVNPWTDTTVGQRGEAYDQFKKEKAGELIRFVDAYFTDIDKHTEKIYVTTPLTYRDYTGTLWGSAYGIIKNHANPLATIIPSRTRIPNLLLAGQNLNVHGALGVTLTSMLTCAEILGTDYLAKQVGKS